MNDIVWNKIILEAFIEDAMLTDEEEMVARTWASNWTRQQQALKLNMSVSTVDRLIKSIRHKYDLASLYNPLIPPRKGKDSNLTVF